MTPLTIRLLLFGLIAANLLLTLSFWPLAQLFGADGSVYTRQHLLAVSMGLVAAQAGVLGLCVYGNGQGVLSRWPHGLFVLVLLSLAVIAGEGITPSATFRFGGANAFFVSLAGLVFLASQAGLALHRRLIGERLTLVHNENNMVIRSRQYSISTLLLWTAEVALVLALGKLLIPTLEHLSAPSEGPLEIIGLMSVLAMIYVLVIIAWVRLLCADRPSVRCACLTIAICGGAILLECAFFCWDSIRYRGWSVVMEIFWPAATVNAALVLTLLPNLLVLRACGYRFQKVEKAPIVPA